MDSKEDKEANIRQAEMLIDEAAEKGAKLVALPEMMNLFDLKEGLIKGAETIPGYSIDRMSRKAKELGIYLHCGSITEKREGEPKIYNTTVMLDPKGEIIARYTKAHLFDIDVPDGVTYKESDTHESGNEIVVVDTAFRER